MVRCFIVLLGLLAPLVPAGGSGGTMTIVGGGSGHLHLQGNVDFGVPPFVAQARITGAVCGL